MLTERDDQEELYNYCEAGIPEISMVYAVKESNRSKLDSHRYFFKGFCAELNPRYCALIDVGTTFMDNAYFGFIQLG